MRVKPILIGGLIAIVGIGTFIYLLPNEEKRIKKQFYLLSLWASKEPGENPLVTAKKARDIGTLFGEKCKLKTPLSSLSGSYSPEEISGYATRGRMQFRELHLKFYDLSVALSEKGLAKVTLTARLWGNLTSGERVDETHEIECVLEKTEGKWLFSQIDMIEVLKK